MSTSKPNILVVDDKPSNLHFFQRILTEKGYKVKRAISGQLALNGAIDAPPDLSAGYYYAHMDGYDLSSLKSNSRNPVIFL
jgi:two-component system sensor histidine kinase/response regulator